MRVSYLRGTRGKDYSELGRAKNLEKFFADHHAMSPAFALDETNRLMFGFKMLDGYGTQGENKPLNIKYSPLHLYKRIDTLKSMRPFAAVCVNGPEKYAGSGETEETNDRREKFYSFITFFDQESVLADEKFNYIDQIFGTHFLTRSEVDLFKRGMKPVDFTEDPSKVDLFIRERDFSVVKFVISVLYHNVNNRVVIKLDQTTDFNERSLELLKQIYSLLPPKMALETGFSSYEDPANVSRLSKELYTRIFTIPNECSVDKSAFPEGTVYIDLGNDFKFDEDTDMSTAITKWVDVEAGVDGKEIDWSKQEGCWEKRKGAMRYAFAEEKEYFTRGAYLACTNNFFGDPFFEWEKSDKISVFSQDDETGYKAVIALHTLFKQYPLCKRIAWVKDRFVAQIPALLGGEKDVNDLKKAIVRDYVASDIGKNKETNAYKNHLFLRDWLNSLDDSDVTFESAEDVAFDVREKTAKEKDTEWTAELERQRARAEETERQYQAALAEKEGNIADLNDRIAEQQANYEAYIRNVQQEAEQRLSESVTYYKGLVEGEKEKYADYKAKIENWEPYKQEEVRKGVEAEIGESVAAWKAEVSRANEIADRKSVEIERLLEKHRAEITRLNEKHQDEQGNAQDKLDRVTDEYKSNRSANEEKIAALESECDNLRQQIDKIRKAGREKVRHLNQGLLVKPILAIVLGILLGSMLGMLIMPKEATVGVEMNAEEDVAYRWQRKEADADWVSVDPDKSGKLTITAEAGKEGQEYRCDVVLPEPRVIEVPVEKEPEAGEVVDAGFSGVSGRSFIVTVNEQTGPVTLKLSDSGEPCVYRLQVKTDRGWSELMGGITDEVTIRPSGNGVEEYRCLVISQ